MHRSALVPVLAALLVGHLGCSPAPPTPPPTTTASRTLKLTIDPASFPMADFKAFSFSGVLQCDPSEDATITGTVYVAMYSVSGEGERRIESLPIHRDKPGVFSFKHSYQGYQLHFPAGQVRIFASFGDPPDNATDTAYFDFDPSMVKPE